MRTRLIGRMVIGMTVAILLACVVGYKAAEWKPTKPIQFVVPYAPGGGSDVLARSIENVIKTEKLCPVAAHRREPGRWKWHHRNDDRRSIPWECPYVDDLHLRPGDGATWWQGKESPHFTISR